MLQVACLRGSRLEPFTELSRRSEFLEMLLKEQDELIHWMLGRAAALGLVAAAELAERLCDEHRLRPQSSELGRICPHVRKILKPLAIVNAVHELDRKTRLLKRSHVPITFTEVRQIL